MFCFYKETTIQAKSIWHSHHQCSFPKGYLSVNDKIQINSVNIFCYFLKNFVSELQCVVPGNIYTHPHRRFFFSLNPTLPLQKFQFNIILFLKDCAIETPSTLEFPITFLGVGMELHNESKVKD